MSEAISSNLIRYRKARGLSQTALAEQVGMSRSSYRALEKGNASPAMPELRAMAKALRVPLPSLLQPVPALAQVRFRSLKRLKGRAQVLAEVAARLADLRDLETLLGASRPDGLAVLREQLASRGVAGAAAAVQARATFGLDDKEPVHDICGLLESHGVSVFRVRVQNDAFLGLAVGPADGGPAVAVNTWERLAVEHWIFSAAHELGHLLMHFGGFNVHELLEDDQEESEANAFASHFLMPEPAFQREWRDAAGWPLLDRVLKVKRIFRVSWRTVMFRATESLPPAQRGSWWKRIAYEHKQRARKPLLKLHEPSGIEPEAFRAPVNIAGSGREPARLDEHDFQSDRVASLVRTGVEEAAISLGRGAEILDIPLAQMRERAASWLG